MTAIDPNKKYIKILKKKKSNIKGRILDKSTAFLLLKEIINSKAIWYEITIPSLIMLTQLLIEDFDNTHDSAIISEIKSYIDIFNSPTESVQFSINLAILNSKIKLVDGKINEAEDVLVKNLNLSDLNGYYYNKQAIQDELEKLREEKTRWTELLQNNQDDLKKLQLADFKNYLEEAKIILSIKN